MSYLSQVSTGLIQSPHLVIIYGPDGVGKSTFAKDAGSTIFIGAEKGTKSMDVARFPQPKSFAEALAMVKELVTAAHSYKTLAIDSLDWLEVLVFAQVCKDASVDQIEMAYGGFGKGYMKALEWWRQLIAALTELQDKRGMNVVLIAHAQSKEYQDPRELKSYPRFMLKLNDKAAALWREFVDAVLFATYEVHVTKTENGKNRAFGSGARVMFTEWRPGHDAKNRYGLPYQLPLSWEAFSEAVKAGQPESPEVLTRQITEMLPQLKDQGLAAKVSESMTAAGTDAIKLAKILNRLESLVQSQTQ